MSENNLVMQRKAALAALMNRRKQAYSLIFGNTLALGEGKVVWEDLSRFCREKETCFHPDPRIHAALEGRREVFLRIRDYLDLSVEELCRKYGREDQ
jgi:hypothetical protein